MGARYDTVKEAAQMAFQARKAIKNGDFTPFIPALAFAIMKDGLLDMIPIVGNLLGLFITVYLFIFLWGKGKWKVRIVIFFLSLFDVIPAVNLIPFSTICVLYAYYQAKKLADRAKKELPEITGIQANAQMIRKYQKAQSMASAQEAGSETQPPSKFSQAADWVPVVGSAKMIGEAVTGKQFGGRELSGTERVRHGVAGAGFLAADMTGVGEVARLGKAGMMAAKIGEREVAQMAGKQVIHEGGQLYESGKERSRIQSGQVSAPRMMDGAQGQPSSEGAPRMATTPVTSMGTGSAPSFQTPPPMPSGSGMTPVMAVGGSVPDEVSEGSIGAQNILQEEVTEETGGAVGTVVEGAHFQQLELMRREKEVGAPLHREAREHRDKLLAGRGNFQLSKNDFDQHFSKGDFVVHEGLRQQNVGDCYAVAALHAFSQSPNFEMMVRSSTKRLPDGSWEVKIPLLDKNAETITVSPEEMQSQWNPGFLKRHGGVMADGILPDLRMKLDPVKASEGYRVLEAAYMKSKFGLNKINRLAAEGGQGEEFLLQLGGKENFLSYSLSSPKYDGVEKKWKYPGLSSLPEEKMSYLDHLLETFDPDVFVATANTKFLDKTKLSNKVLDALGLPFYKATGANKMFVAGHAYSLTKVDKEKKIVTLANPWNTKKPIELTIQQFKETFSEVSAVRIYHGKLLENMKNLHPNE